METRNPPVPILADLRCRAIREDIVWSRVLEESGVHPSTWCRSLASGRFKAETIDRLTAALDYLIETTPKAKD